MKKNYGLLSFVLLMLVFFPSIAPAQDKKLDKIRVGGGSASATQMSLWLAKEGNYYGKHGLNVEAISIPGSSLALQAMLAGDLPIIQLGGAASIQANFSGADTVIIATIVRKFLFWIFAKPGIERMEDLRGKVFGTTRFGTLSDLAARFALRAHGIDPERDITMVQTGGPAEAITAMVAGKIDAAAFEHGLHVAVETTLRLFEPAGNADREKVQTERTPGYVQVGSRVSYQRRRHDSEIFESARGHRSAFSQGVC